MSDIKYTKDHEWLKIEGENVLVGITEHAATALGTLVYVELPEVGSNLSKGDACAVVESSKSASDVYSPISGIITAVNNKLEDEPELINKGRSGDIWIFKIKADDLSEVDGMMNLDDYKEFTKED